MKDNKIFPWLVAFSAFTISFSAAFYSVYGISKMFAGASTNVMIMAGSLEFSKLVIASFLYRYWNEINKVLKVYLTVACLILICITSAGIYGYLSSAYQETANKVEKMDKSTSVILKQKMMLEKELAQAEKQLEYKNQRQVSLADIRSKQQANQDNLISNNKSVSGIKYQSDQTLKESSKIDADIKTIQDTIGAKTKQISELELQILSISSNSEVASEIGPLKYISKLTGKPMDQVVNWFIFTLMLVFDPLAIALVIAANFIFEYVNKEKENQKKKDYIQDEKDVNGYPIEEEIDEQIIEEELEAIQEEYTGFSPAESKEEEHPYTRDPTRIK